MKFLDALWGESQSRKAQVLLVLIAMVLFGQKLGMTADQVENAAYGMMAYIFGQGVADSGFMAKRQVPE